MHTARSIFKVLAWIWVFLLLPFAWVIFQGIEQLPRKGFPDNLYATTLGFLFLPGWPIILTGSVLGLLPLATLVTGIITLLGKKEDTHEAGPPPGPTSTMSNTQGTATQMSSSPNTQQKTALLHRYLQSVISKTKDLNPTGIHQSSALLSVNVPLEEIFIHIRAVSDRPLFDIGIEQKKLLEEIEKLRQRTDPGPLPAAL